MKKVPLLRVFAFFLLTVLVFSCKAETRDDSDNSGLPKEKEFIGSGASKDFGAGKEKAYSDLLRHAVVFIIGEDAFQKNKDAIERSLLPYKVARKYVVGETESVDASRDRKWLPESKDSEGNTVFQLKALVYLRVLKKDIDALGVKYGSSAHGGSGDEAADRLFIGVGSSKDFGEGKQRAYVDAVKKAVVSLIGEDGYKRNKDTVDRVFLSYKLARVYVLGEVDTAPNGKDREWLPQSKDSDGNTVFQLKAWVNMKKLRDDLKASGVIR